MSEGRTDVTRDIGWRQFSINVLDMLRWPIAVIVIVLLLGDPIRRLIDAISTAVLGR